VVENFSRDLMLTPFDRDRFATTACGVLHIVDETTDDRGRALQKVTQRRAGIELSGWVSEPIAGLRGSHRCSHPVVYAECAGCSDQLPVVPAGYLTVAPAEADRVADRTLGTGTTVYWLLDEAEGTICRAFRVEGDELVSEPYRDPESDDVTLIVAHYGVRRRGAFLELTGPTWVRRTADGREHAAEARCLDLIQVVDAGDDRLLVMHGATTERAVYAYHPEAPEPWFLSEASCRQAAELRNANPPTSEPSRYAGGTPQTHSGC
jgi:hypothetical protein